MSQLGMPIDIFFSYAPKDQRLRDQFETQLSLLKQQGLISSWHDRKIGAGKDWLQEANSHLEAAQIILLLISPGFIASDYCYGVEMKRAMERHEAGQCLVIPIILRRVTWEDTPFQKLDVLPANAKPATGWRNLVQKEKVNTPIIIVSAAPNKEIVRGIKIGADGFVEKPFTFGELTTVVEGVLGNRTTVFMDSD